MDLNNLPDFDTVWTEIVDELHNDNTEEEYTGLVIERQQQADNTTGRRRRRTILDRSREEGHNRLLGDYFSEKPVYTETQFRRRFRMRKHVFHRIVEALGNHDEYFQMRVGAVRRRALSPLQKCTAAIRILAYGSPADSVDDYVRIGESTALECLERFVTGVCAIFGAEYLRRPNNEDIARLLQMGQAHGFPGSNNDINVLNQSDVFTDVLNGEALTVQYTVNRTSYHMGYYLADDIYPEWTTFVKTISMPQGENYLPNDKNQQERMWNRRLECSNLDSRLYVARHALDM